MPIQPPGPTRDAVRPPSCAGLRSAGPSGRCALRHLGPCGREGVRRGRSGHRLTAQAAAARRSLAGLSNGRPHPGGTLGAGPSVYASLVSLFAFNFFFTPPYCTFAVKDKGGVATLVFFLAMAALTGELSSRVRDETGRHQAASRTPTSSTGAWRLLSGRTTSSRPSWTVCPVPWISLGHARAEPPPRSRATRAPPANRARWRRSARDRGYVPHSSTTHWGFHATSQRWPSGSWK
jgi:hypothetical protein